MFTQIVRFLRSWKRYNRSINYALAVHELALELRTARKPDG